MCQIILYLLTSFTLLSLVCGFIFIIRLYMPNDWTELMNWFYSNTKKYNIFCRRCKLRPNFFYILSLCIYYIYRKQYTRYCFNTKTSISPCDVDLTCRACISNKNLSIGWSVCKEKRRSSTYTDIASLFFLT